jgi:hypothetical protein
MRYRLIYAGAIAAAAILTSLAPAHFSRADDEVVLIEDDFSRFSPGLLSAPIGQLNPAIQEYHYLAHRGVPLAPWANAIGYLDAWAAGDEDDRPYIEQHLSPDHRWMEPRLFSPLFITGEPEWTDYTVEVSVRPLSFSDMAGITFRYQTNRHHVVLVLRGGKQLWLAARLPLEEKFREAGWRELASAPLQYDTTRYYRLKVENAGETIRAYVDGKLMFEAREPELRSGKVGVTANVPARFQSFKATASAKTRQSIDKAIADRKAELVKLRAGNPAPKLWKKFATPRYGAGRNVRFGDLDGDGRPEMLIAQNVAKVDNGNFVEISCLTAVDLDGRVLWQIGRPDVRNALLTSDTPFQIHDLDGDGQGEVVLVKDFKLQVFDGRTGKQKAWAWAPQVPADFAEKKQEIKDRPHELNMGDSISFFNFSGNKQRHEMVLKDRYRNFWVLDNQLKPLWQGGGQLGHFPFAYADRDGYDKLMIGYAMWDHTGKQVWSRDEELRDHADSVAFGNFSDDPQAAPLAYYSGSDEGFILIDAAGVIRRHWRIGHAQTAAIGKFRDDLPGLQYCAINFWKNPGIVTLFDSRGDILLQAEPVHSGSPLLPVNWRGDSQEFILLSASTVEGGLMDGHLRRVVMFPDDGHPDLCATVLDLTGDERDEIVVWDQQQVWIYTQDRPFEGRRIYAPERNPDYNDSNYRVNLSLPGWRDVGGK